MIELYVFYASWCSSCGSIDKALPKNIKVTKFNIDENIELVQKLNIEFVPTIIIMKDGIEVYRFDDDSVLISDIEKAIEKYETD